MNLLEVCKTPKNGGCVYCCVLANADLHLTWLRPVLHDELTMNETHIRSETIPSETRPVELTRNEGLQLLTFLEERIKSSDTKASEETLATVLVKLCDADTIALWLRENTFIKITRKEAANILKALEARLGESASKSSSPLASVARKLNEVFYYDKSSFPSEQNVLKMRKDISHLDLVRAAILAPTPDNNQPWLFGSEGEELLVYLDPRRTLPSDVNFMFDLLGLGAAIENVRLAASGQGYATSVDDSPVMCGDLAACESVGKSVDKEVDGPKLVARLSFGPGGEADPLVEQLESRCTCRKLYSTQPLGEECLERLSDAVAEFGEVHLDWITDRLRIRSLSGLLASSDRVRFEYEPFHNEIFRQLRFTVDEAEQTRDGLDLRTLELPPGAGAMLGILRPWNRMKWLHRLGVGRMLTVPSAVSVCKSSAIGVLSLGEPSAAGFLRAGQAFQRIWLAADAEKLSLQPLGSLAVFFAHVQQLDGKKLSSQHQELITRLIPRFGGLVPPARGRCVQMLFRVGKSARPEVRSLRRAVEEVMCSQGACLNGDMP